MNFVHLVAVLAVAQFFAFGTLVARARGQYGVHAPAVTGHPMFERALRVQMNTLEQLAAFLPTLYIAAQYWPPAAVAGIGAVYLIGRLIYWRAYMADPATRSLGFLLTVLPIFAFMGMAGVGMLIR